MPCLVSPLERANGILRLHDLPLRIRVRRHSQWLSVYEILPGGGTRERAMRGYSAQSEADVQRLCDALVEQGRGAAPQNWPALAEASAASAAHLAQPCWPEICEAVVAFQRGQGVNMNLVGPFKGKGYFCLLPADRPATEADVRRFALHSSESLKARLEDPAAPLLPMATHRQGFRQKSEVVSPTGVDQGFAPCSTRGLCQGIPLGLSGVRGSAFPGGFDHHQPPPALD